MYASSNNLVDLGYIISFGFSDADVYKNKFLEDWGHISQLRKPLIAAVSGYAVRLKILRRHTYYFNSFCAARWRV